MSRRYKLAILAALALCATAPAAIADTLEERAARDIAASFAALGLDGLRRQLYAPGKTEEEKDAMIDAAVQAFAECRVATSIEFAEEYGLSALTLLRWQAGWELTEEDRDTMTRLDGAAFREKQKPCGDSFQDALPVRLSQ